MTVSVENEQPQNNYIEVHDGSRHAIISEQFADELNLGNLDMLLASPLNNPVRTGGPQRAAVGRFGLSSGRRVIVRRGIRGGFMKYLLSDIYLHTPDEAIRSVEEFKTLSLLFEREIAVPRPVLAWWRFLPCTPFYRGGLITEEIRDAETLFTLAISSADQFAMLHSHSKRIGAEAAKMLRAGVYHPDLHPGNTLVRDSSCWIIDFDKAIRFDGPGGANTAPFRKKLWHRWRRAVEKYDLPEIIATGFYEGMLNASP